MTVVVRIVLLLALLAWFSHAAELISAPAEQETRSVAPAAETSQTKASVDDPSNVAPDVLLVVGAGGEAEYAKSFAESADLWVRACERGQRTCLRIDPDLAEDSTPSGCADAIRDAIASAGGASPDRPLWIVLIGHGTWDGQTARFNLAGKDVSAAELKEWLQPLARPVIIVNGSSSSGPFIDRLSAPNRVVVTATKSGSEKNYTRFSRFFAEALQSADADLDHDDAISVREAFLKASDSVERFYKDQGRLVTEHALLDDNGDRKGSDDSLVSGRADTKGGESVDGDLADEFAFPATEDIVPLSDEQIRKRNRLEAELESVVAGTDPQDRDELRQRVLPILVKLAELYGAAEQAQDDEQPSPPK